MNSLRNKVQLIGNLGANPEIIKTDKGIVIAKMRMATNETYRDKDGKSKTDTQWHQVIAFSGLATVCEKYLSKGSEIAIEGKIVYRNYEDKEGKTRYVTEIRASDLLMFRNGKNEELEDLAQVREDEQMPA